MSWGLFPRKPDFIVGEADDPYLRRWHLLPRNKWFNIYLHHFLRSDDDRALHDHPYQNVSILLRGQYMEHLADGRVRTRRAPQVIFRAATTAHRIHLFGGKSPQPAWTLFITGPRVREWGFWCGNRWVHQKDFGNETTGKGCN